MKKLMMSAVMISAAIVAFGEEKSPACSNGVCELKSPVVEKGAAAEDSQPTANSSKQALTDSLKQRQIERRRVMQARFQERIAKQKEAVAKILVDSGLDEVKAKEAAEKIAEVYSLHGPLNKTKRFNRKEAKPAPAKAANE